MKLQKFQIKSEKIRYEFDKLKAEHPEKLQRRIDVSFCNSMFGQESIFDSIERLSGLGYNYIEMFGNYGGPDVGYHTQLPEILKAMEHYKIKCSGVAPFMLPGMSLTTEDYFCRQRAIDYVRENLKFCHAVGGTYYLVTPGPCGKTQFFGGEYDRSVSTLRSVGDIFTSYGIKGAVEPVLRDLTPFCHDVAEAKAYIRDVDHPGIRHIYGDTQHLLAGCEHIGDAILEAGEQLLCLHLKDTLNGKPIGNGMLDVDTVIRALYVIGFNSEGHYVTGEPNPGAYAADDSLSLFTRLPEQVKKSMAADNINYFKEREEEVLNG